MWHMVSIGLKLHLDILSKVTLRPHKDERSEGGVFPNLRNPLLRNILEGGWTDNAEAQQEHICTGVTQRTQLVKLILERLGEKASVQREC